jgi:hypothetical protein
MTDAVKVNEVNAGAKTGIATALMPSLAIFAVLLASLFNFLSTERYPILTPEVAVVVSAFACAALLAGMLYSAAGPTLRFLFQALFALLTFDLNFDGWVVPAGTAATLIIARSNVMAFLGIAAFVVILTELPFASYGRGNQSSAPAPVVAGDASLPPLLHIILDEHIGAEGLVGDDAALEMRDRLRAFYRDNGFMLFGGAFSEYLHTINSIPTLLNFGEQQPWSAETSKERATVQHNQYFDLLKKEGYAVSVYQAYYVEYCRHPAVVACKTSPPTSLLSLDTDRVATSDKAALIGKELARLSGFVSLANEAIYQLTGIGLHLRGSTLPQGFPALETLETLAADVRQAPPGSAFFVHVLFPHYPYLVERDCSSKPRSDWLLRGRAPGALHSLNERRVAYYEQLSCLLLVLQRIYDAAGTRFIVVVHGDHGSRIGRIDPTIEDRGRFGPNDLISGFSTLYAIRAPSIPVGYDRRALPINLLFREFVTSGFQGAAPTIAPDFAPSVILEDFDWKPTVRHPMPAGWPAQKNNAENG